MMVTSADVRSALWSGLAAAGPSYWLGAAFVTIVTNLADFATVPVPGERPPPLFIAAAVLRVLLVFFAAYAIERRIAGLPDPLRPVAFPRFALFTFLWTGAFAAVSRVAAAALGLNDMPLESQWLTLLVITVVWGLATIRLVGWAAALATGGRLAALPAQARALKGAGLPLALAWLQVVVPFVAVHYALSLLGSRLALSPAAVAALAVVDGAVSAIVLLLDGALAVTAWRLAQGQAGALRGQAGRR